MRIPFSKLFSTLLITAAPAAIAQSIAPPYEVGTWQGFKTAAISFTFDDDCPNQYALAVPMFNARGLKMTLFTVTSWLGGNYTPVQNAALAGHEIASHTVTHVSLGGLPLSQQAGELTNSQNAIIANVPGQQCLEIAYPNCIPSDETLTSQYYIAGRTCSGVVVPSTPVDFYQIGANICGSAGNIQTYQNFTNAAYNAYIAKGWMVYLIHAIDNDPGYSPLPSTVLQQSVDYFSGNLDKYWVQTFGNVVRYIKERNAASIAESANTGDTITIQVTDGLNDSIYNYPITVRRPMPNTWVGANVTQNGSPISSVIVPSNGTNFLMFDVVPDGGDVVMSNDPNPPTPVMSLSPTNQDFGSVAIGQSSDRTFTVLNTAGGTLGGNVTLSPPFTLVAGSPYYLASNQTATVTIRFVPSLQGVVTSTIAFSGGGGSSAQVTGTGFGFVPAKLTSGRITNGVYNFTLTGMGGSNYVILTTSDLKSWVPMMTSSIPDVGTMLFSDPNITNTTLKLYRSQLQ